MNSLVIFAETGVVIEIFLPDIFPVGTVQVVNLVFGGLVFRVIFLHFLAFILENRFLNSFRQLT